MATETFIRIGVDARPAEEGARRVARSLEQIRQKNKELQRDGTDAFNKLKDSIFSLRTAIAGLGIAAFASQFVRLADSANLIEARLRIVTSSSEELAMVYDRLLEIANATRNEFEGTATLYQRMARSQDELGRSTEELLRVTDIVSKAIVVSGASSQEARAGVIQFSQALASGELRGDEFRSVLENLTGVAKAIAEGFDETGGVAIGALREMAADGELTAEKIITALLRMGDKIDEEFKQMPLTVGQAFTVLRNNVQDFAKDINDATGFTATLASAILVLADNIDILAQAAAGLLVLGLPAFFRAASAAAVLLTRAVVGLTAAALANPFVAMAAALGFVATQLAFNADQIKVFEGDLATLKDFGTVALTEIGNAWEQVTIFVGDLIDKLSDMDLGFSSSFSLIGAGLRLISDSILAWANLFINSIRAVIALFGELGSAIVDTLGGAFNDALAIGAGFFQDFAELFEGDFSFDKFSAALDKESETGQALERTGQIVADIFNDEPIQRWAGLAVDAVDDFAQSWRKAAEEVAKFRQLEEIAAKDIADNPGIFGGGPRKPRTGGGGGDDKKDKFADQFDQLRRSLDENFDAFRKFEEGSTLIEEAMKRGVITLAEYDDLMEKLADSILGVSDAQKKLETAIDDIGSIIERTRTPIEAYNEALSDLDALEAILQTEEGLRALEEAGIDAAIAMEALSRARGDAAKDLLEEIDKDRKKFEDTANLGRDFANVISSAFEDAITSGENLRQTLGALLVDIGKIITRVTITKPLENALTEFLSPSQPSLTQIAANDVASLPGIFGGGGAATSGGGVGGFLSSAFGFLGSLFGFAKGGIVNQPTLFPMGGGNVGLTGEAGPEAIIPATPIAGGFGITASNGSVLPLTRLGDGSLGVNISAFAAGAVLDPRPATLFRNPANLNQPRNPFQADGDRQRAAVGTMRQDIHFHGFRDEQGIRRNRSRILTDIGRASRQNSGRG